LEAVPGKHWIDSLQKTAILGTSHIIRKVLQCEAWSLSGEDQHWFKRSTRKKRLVTREDNNDDNNNNNNNLHHVNWKVNQWRIVPMYAEKIMSSPSFLCSLQLSCAKTTTFATLFPHTWKIWSHVHVWSSSSKVRNALQYMPVF
jgi:hypothetical protein